MTLICTRCSKAFGTERIRDLCHMCQLAQQEAWPHSTHQYMGEACGS